MANSPVHLRQFRNTLLQRELGLSPSAASLHTTPLLGSFHTTPSTEYTFRSTTSTGQSIAIPPYALSYSRTALNGHALAAGDEEGILTILNTNLSLPTSPPVARFRAHDNAIFDLIWHRADTQIATCSGDGSVRLFDIEGTYRRALLRATTKSVKSVRAMPGSDDVLFTASRDGNVRAFDVRCPAKYDPTVYPEAFHSPVFSIRQPHARRTHVRKRRRVEADPLGSVTALAVRPGRPHEIYTAGAADGAVKLWDIRAAGRSDLATSVGLPGCKERCVAAVSPCLQRPGAPRTYGIAGLAVDQGGGRLLVSSTDSRIYVYDAGDLGIGYSKCLGGHAQTGFYIRAKFSPCGRYVLSGSADSKGYLWDTRRGERFGVVDPVFELEGHRGGETAAVDWCVRDPFEVATCGDDSSVKVWRVDPGRSPAGREGEEDGDGGLLNGARIARVGEGKCVKKGAVGKMGRSAVRKLRDADIRMFFSDGIDDVKRKVPRVH